MGKRRYFWPHERRARKRRRDKVSPSKGKKSRSHLIRLSNLPKREIAWLWRRRIRRVIPKRLVVVDPMKRDGTESCPP
jgi:hypothetical protein